MYVRACVRGCVCVCKWSVVLCVHIVFVVCAHDECVLSWCVFVGAVSVGLDVRELLVFNTQLANGYRADVKPILNLKSISAQCRFSERSDLGLPTFLQRVLMLVPCRLLYRPDIEMILNRYQSAKIFQYVLADIPPFTRYRPDIGPISVCWLGIALHQTS